MYVSRFDRAVVADVVHAPGCGARRGVGARRVERRVRRRGPVEHADRAVDDVVDVREVARHVATVEDLDRPALDDRVREQHRAHVRSSPRPVDREIAQAGRRQAEEMAVAVRHQLVRLLRRGVEADRMVDRIAFGERQLAVAAVHRRRARVDEMADRVAATGLDDVREADQVAARVRAGVDERVADAGLRGEVQHAVEARVGEQPRDAVGVGDVELLEAEAGQRLELRQPVALQADVVVVVQVVDADDVVAAREQRLRGEEADEPGAAGDQHRHRCSTTVPSAASVEASRAASRDATRGSSTCSARSFAYFAKLLKQPIAMCTSPGSPSRNPSRTT